MKSPDSFNAPVVQNAFTMPSTEEQDGVARWNNFLSDKRKLLEAGSRADGVVIETFSDVDSNKGQIVRFVWMPGKVNNKVFRVPSDFELSANDPRDKGFPFRNKITGEHTSTFEREYEVEFDGNGAYRGDVSELIRLYPRGIQVFYAPRNNRIDDQMKLAA